MSQQRVQSAAAFAAGDNSRGTIHSPASSTGRPQVRLWIGGELKLRLSSPAPARSSALNESLPLQWLSRGVAAAWRRVLPSAQDI